jgi:hypothetical protein
MPQITESDFDECRRHRAREGWKHAMWDAGCKLPTPNREQAVALLLRR